MTNPVLHPSEMQGQGPGVAYRIEGELVPVLHMNLGGQVPVYFENHTFLWKQPRIDIALHPMKKGWKRLFGGMPLFMTETRGAGEIAFSRDQPGHVFPLHLAPGQEVLVREHQFLAATGTIEYDFERAGGVGTMLFGSQGFFIDKFRAGPGGGVLFLHAHGNAFDVDLAEGEQIDVEPGGWVYRERTVGYEQKIMGLKSGMLAGTNNFIFNRFTGPGRVGLQSGYPSGIESGAVSGNDTATRSGAGLLGAAIGAALG